MSHNLRAYAVVALVTLGVLAFMAIPRLIGRRKPLNRVDLAFNTVIVLLSSLVIIYH